MLFLRLAVASALLMSATACDRDSPTTTSDVPGWDSGTISPGRQFSFTFQTDGTYPYHCSFHPGMTGTAVVTEAAGILQEK
jgi:plastocyanin